MLLFFFFLFFFWFLDQITFDVFFYFYELLLFLFFFFDNFLFFFFSDNFLSSIFFYFVTFLSFLFFLFKWFFYFLTILFIFLFILLCWLERKCKSDFENTLKFLILERVFNFMNDIIVKEKKKNKKLSKKRYKNKVKKHLKKFLKFDLVNIFQKEIYKIDKFLFLEFVQIKNFKKFYPLKQDELQDFLVKANLLKLLELKKLQLDKIEIPDLIFFIASDLTSSKDFLKKLESFQTQRLELLGMLDFMPAVTVTVLFLQKVEMLELSFFDLVQTRSLHIKKKLFRLYGFNWNSKKFIHWQNLQRQDFLEFQKLRRESILDYSSFTFEDFTRLQNLQLAKILCILGQSLSQRAKFIEFLKMKIKKKRKNKKKKKKK